MGDEQRALRKALVAFAILEALVLIPLIVYIAFKE